MQMWEVHDFARQFRDQHGDKAEAEAAQKLRECEARGDKREVKNWRRVRAALKEMKTTHVS